MMQSPSKIRSDGTPLVLDASVVINLVASNYIDGILHFLNRPIVVTENVCTEFKLHPRKGGSSKEVIETLICRRRIQIVKMSDAQFESFLQLTGHAPPDDLGDGEAATLACADGMGSAVIDDKKALRIAVRDLKNQELYCSLDLICAEQVVRSLGRTVVANSVYDAIKFARMRVPHSWRNWVIELIGKTRTAETCLIQPTLDDAIPSIKQL